MTLETIGQANIKKITDILIKDMESHDISKPYTPKWNSKLHVKLTGEAYTGWNQLHLSMLYPKTPVWGTYKQYNKVGLHPRPKTGVPLWVPFITKTKEDEVIVKDFFKVAIFNIEDVDGDPELIDYYKTLNQIHKEHTEKINETNFIASTQADIEYGGNKACYIPSTDKIRIPNIQDFITKNSYYSTIFHELTHWTGAKHRLDRNHNGKFASKDYAFEELIAELGASFLASHFNFFSETREDHTQYLSSWVRLLKKEPKAMLSASSKAHKAYDFLVNKNREQHVNIKETQDGQLS